MLAVDWRASVVALSLLFAVFQYVRRTAGPSRWADSRRSYHLQQVRANLIKAAAEPAHDRDWRPYILAFSNSPTRRRRLLCLAEWIEGGSGMTTLVQILEGEGLKMLARRKAARRELQQAILEGGFNVFPLAVTSEDVESGVHHLVQAAGIGPLSANTVLVNWKGTSLPHAQGFHEMLFGRHLREAFRQGCHVVILATDEAKWPPREDLSAGAPRIDLWWRDDATGRLMLLLAYLVTRHADWSQAQIRVLAPDAALPGTPDEDEGSLADMLETLRIQGEPVILPCGDMDELVQQTADAALLFLPFRFRDNLIQLDWPGPMEDLLGNLPTTVMVTAARELDLEAAPEEGVAADRASAQDRIEELQSRYKLAEQEAAQAAEAVAQVRHRLLEMIDAETSFIDLQAKKALARQVEAAELAARKTRRRALKLGAKLDQAQQEATNAGLMTSDDKEDNPVDQAGN
jgi:hypothetical protein